jgi:hypothetical protein
MHNRITLRENEDYLSAHLIIFLALMLPFVLLILAKVISKKLKKEKENKEIMSNEYQPINQFERKKDETTIESKKPLKEQKRNLFISL